MARRSLGPWFRKGRGWFATRNSRQFKIAPAEVSKADANAAWHAFMASPLPVAPPPLPGRAVAVADLVEAFLAWVAANRKPATASLAERVLLPIAASDSGARIAESWRPIDAMAAAEANHAGRPGMRRESLSSQRTAWRWAFTQGLIERDSLAGLKVPKTARGAGDLDAAAVEAFRTAAGPALRDDIDFAIATGCRPQEVRAIARRHLNHEARAVQFPAEEGKGNRARVIYCPAAAWGIVERLVPHALDGGPIFRNSDGTPWTKDALVRAVRRAAARANLQRVTFRRLRHTWVTEGLLRGVDPVTLAELAGHADTTMVSRQYQHVARRVEHMRAAAEKAAGGGATPLAERPPTSSADRSTA